MIILGWILFIVGIAFLILSFAGAFTEIAKRIKESVRTGLVKTESLGKGIGDITKLFEALKAFIEALTKAPQWLVMFLAGLVLIYIGNRLIAGLSPFPFV